MRLRKRDIGRHVRVSFWDHTEGEPLAEVWAEGQIAGFDKTKLVLNTWDTSSGQHTANDRGWYEIARATIKAHEWLYTRAELHTLIGRLKADIAPVNPNALIGLEALEKMLDKS